MTKTPSPQVAKLNKLFMSALSIGAPIEMLERMIANKKFPVDINYSADSGYSPIYAAVSSLNADIVSFVIRHGGLNELTNKMVLARAYQNCILNTSEKSSDEISKRSKILMLLIETGVFSFDLEESSSTDLDELKKSIHKDLYKIMRNEEIRREYNQLMQEADAQGELDGEGDDEDYGHLAVVRERS